MSLLREYVGTLWGRMAVLGLLILASTGLALAGPQILQRAIDAASSGTTAHALVRLGLLYMVTMLATDAVKGAVKVSSSDVSWLATNRLRGHLARHVLNLPMHFHTQFTPGYIAERIDGDVGALEDFFSRFLLMLFTNAVFLFGAIGVLFWKDWHIGLTFLLSLLVTVIAFRMLANVAVPAARAERQAQSEMMGVLEENLNGAEDARALGASPFLLQRFLQAGRNHMFACQRSWVLSAIPFAVTLVILGINEALCLSIGVGLVEKGIFTIGTIYLIMQYNRLVGYPLRDLSQQLGSLQSAGASIQRIHDLLEREPEPGVHAAIPRSLPRGPLGVRFRDVTFAYPGGPPVLKGLNLVLAPGHSLGVVGRTGGGKSSLARLLLRLYEPTSGSICLSADDESFNIGEIPLGDLRRRVSLVTQEVQLFPASVRENLTLFGALGDVPEEKLIWAMKEVGLEGWLRRLPERLDTVLVKAEQGLSAGQAQLLALARVFLADPGLVLLDEASSRLDPSSQAVVEQAVDRLLDGRTAIVISHRLSALQRVDDILVIEEGTVVEAGRREALAAQPSSRYYGLLRAEQRGLETGGV
ncbi:MAG: ABC transporter ATP-binding protein [Candidatus Coatesbacteria bacterium]